MPSAPAQERTDAVAQQIAKAVIDGDTDTLEKSVSLHHLHNQKALITSW